MHVNTVHTAALAKMAKPAVVHPGTILPGKLLFSLSIVAQISRTWMWFKYFACPDARKAELNLIEKNMYLIRNACASWKRPCCSWSVVALPVRLRAQIFRLIQKLLSLIHMAGAIWKFSHRSLVEIFLYLLKTFTSRYFQRKNTSGQSTQCSISVGWVFLVAVCLLFLFSFGFFYDRADEDESSLAEWTLCSKAEPPTSVNTSWRSNFTWIIFLVSSSLVCQFLWVALLTQTTTKSVYLWCRSQRDIISFVGLERRSHKPKT